MSRVLITCILLILWVATITMGVNNGKKNKEGEKISTKIAN